MRRSAHEPVFPVMPTEVRSPVADFEQSSDSLLVEAISRGSVPAFAVLFDRTSHLVRAELAVLPPETGQRSEVLAATYLEVWWLAGCRTGPERIVADWIVGVVRRRIAEARAGLDQRDIRGLAGRTKPSYAELELAALLHCPVSCLAEDDTGRPPGGTVRAAAAARGDRR